MELTLLKSKIHRATVTDANLEYEGSITLDKALCDKANIFPFEKVEIYNCNNGARFSTYVIYGDKGDVCLNGAAARHVHKGDLVIIACYAGMTPDEAAKHQPALIFVDEENTPKSI